MFGLKDAQKIYHEVFFQLVMKDKKKIKVFITKAKNICTMVSSKISVIKRIIESLVTEKELFFDIAKNFSSFHFIVIDDLERMNDSIMLEEVFGIIDELKRCNYVKIILVANTKEISQKERFKKYSEKVIDRTYYVTECPEIVDWAKLKIHHGFITEFLNKHHVKNLRTLQKAQNLYDDVINKDIVKIVNKTVKVRVINEYVRYLSENTHGEQAYQYSYTLREYANNTFLKDAISGNVDALYNEKSFPIYDVTEQQYGTAYNIMYVLYHENKDRFLDYCNEIKTRCDNMAAHRIEVLLEEISR